MTRDLGWLIERPIAHRGLHDYARGVIENSIAAARAAVSAGYAIECDVQRASDGEIFVFHDDTLERLTEGRGDIRAHHAAALSALTLAGGGEQIPRFTEFLDAVAGRAPLIVEIKSFFDGDMRAAEGAARALAAYAGPAVIESFDPDIVAHLRANAQRLGVAHVPLGIVGQARYEADEWPGLTDAQRRDMTHFLHYPRTQPDFLSWKVADYPHAVPALLRDALDLPVTTWTVRSSAQAAEARRWADQIVFEGFSPLP